MIVYSGDELHLLAVEFAGGHLGSTAPVLHLYSNGDVHETVHVGDSVGGHLGERPAPDFSRARRPSAGGPEPYDLVPVPQRDAAEPEGPADKIFVPSGTFFLLLPAVGIPQIFEQLHPGPALRIYVDGSAVVEIDAQGAGGILYGRAVVACGIVLYGPGGSYLADLQAVGQPEKAGGGLGPRPGAEDQDGCRRSRQHESCLHGVSFLQTYAIFR